MRCCNCQAVIPPEWKGAIKRNICPSCGEEIMNEKAQELLSELRDALIAMPNDPEGIAGWLLSHYELVKIGTGEPVHEFYGPKPKRDLENKEEELRKNPKPADNKLEKFYQNARLKSPEEYRKIGSKIKELHPYIDEEVDDAPDYSDDDMPEADDPEYTVQMLENMESPKISKKDYKRLKKKYMEEYKDLDRDDAPDVLQRDRMERLKRQRELQSGGTGVIRRSD